MGWLLGCNMWNCRPDQLSKPCVSEEGLVKQRINGSWLYPRMFTPRNSSNMFKCVWWRLGTGTLNFMMFLVKIYHAFVWGIFLGSCIFFEMSWPIWNDLFFAAFAPERPSYILILVGVFVFPECLFIQKCRTRVSCFKLICGFLYPNNGGNYSHFWMNIFFPRLSCWQLLFRYRGSHVDLVSCELQKRGLQDGWMGAIKTRVTPSRMVNWKQPNMKRIKGGARNWFGDELWF